MKWKFTLYREILKHFVIENLLIKISECQPQVTLSIFHEIIYVFDFRVTKYRIRSLKFTELHLSYARAFRNICTFVRAVIKTCFVWTSHKIPPSTDPFFKNKIAFDVSLIKCQARWPEAFIFISTNKCGIWNDHSNIKRQNFLLNALLTFKDCE